MAIKNEDGYYKIMSITYDFYNNISIIETKMYLTEEDRLREKELSPLVEQFNDNCTNALTTLYQRFESKIGKTVDEDTFLEYINSNEELKAEFEYLSALNTEYQTYMAHLLWRDVNTINLKYIDYWTNLGFTENMCKSIRFKSTPKYFHINKNLFDAANLDYIYKELKSIIDNGEDC